MHVTWFEANTWLVEWAGLRLLFDPWLIGPLVFGKLDWLFKAERRQPIAELPTNLDAIVITQGLEDHCHPLTLSRLERSIPVIASPSAAKVVQGLGYSQVTTLQHGEKTVLAEKLTIQAFPGAPVGPNYVENGYLIREHRTGQTLYYEPHGYHQGAFGVVPSVDVAIAPVVDLGLPFLGAIIRGNQVALELARKLHPQVMLTTALGDFSTSGFLLKFVRAKGDIQSFQQQLIEAGLSTQAMELTPRQVIELPLKVGLNC
ncbi:Putative Zn-dependent hydrolases of the beta-lactamase fold [Gloeomargarita lithophora Alchichica-D10]|uniref:Zn-dependent hydrolases of the beta-lactamase fold n=1 Tax=Gloeomargarita lithophora Alchichica-D10 TaxID=1188229 RepID=A0A1J0AAD5_9CYAN|nr:MBL fold metallo-hydrolase [Gloeomargarita lithophora]APB32865.1 Putative Zn-dependent hydrolases of the beta-lactamase fold [Gloeomargarita lithophora Alchichica-D10]